MLPLMSNTIHDYLTGDGCYRWRRGCSASRTVNWERQKDRQHWVAADSNRAIRLTHFRIITKPNDQMWQVVMGCWKLCYIKDIADMPSNEYLLGTLDDSDGTFNRKRIITLVRCDCYCYCTIYSRMSIRKFAPTIDGNRVLVVHV